MEESKDVKAAKAKTKYGCVIKSCTCANAYQDAMYGTGKRVHNRCKGKTLEPTARCTVCENVKNV